MNTAIIIGFIILGICVIGAAFILSGAITGAATALKNNENPVLQQPTMRYLTEFDAADYLGVSLNELDFMRSEGLLDNTFIAVTSLEQTGEESYNTYDDGVQVSKNRPVMSSVTRFLFNTELLDKRMLELINDGQHINPLRKKSKNSEKPVKKYGNKHDDPVTESASSTSSEPHSSKPSENKDSTKNNSDVQRKNNSQDNQNKNQNKNNGQKSSSGNKNSQRPQQKKPTVHVPVEDDSDMKIVKPEGSKKNGTVYSDGGSASDSSSPVYSASGDQNDVKNIPIVKPSQKSISKPRIAVIANDDNDEE